ncbi:MAG: MarR family transcriptional regulator [Bacteroidetes bacterium HGW-Bacteroidetes-8]|jgi:DNA-binding MarR family transcriptional regulator|nr:MAG: MarR family transcriptional regulator [Bacteroidetes bacterium HGW-Bacteroidetes-8]
MKKLCIIRDICRSISDFENEFQKTHNLCLNEGMVLCSLKERRLSSGEIAKQINLTCSNTSKLIRSIEDKGLIKRVLGEEDKRQMYFSLTQKGILKLTDIEEDKIALTGPLSKLG